MRGCRPALPVTARTEPRSCPNIPSLGAQPAFYTTVQLLMFRDKLRVTEPMNEMAKGLTDAELQKAADIISKLPPPVPVSDTPDAARMEKARALSQQHRCNFCHQANYAGRENVPGWPASARTTCSRRCAATRTIRDAASRRQMSEVVYDLKDEDFVELAYFLARQK